MKGKPIRGDRRLEVAWIGGLVLLLAATHQGMGQSLPLAPGYPTQVNSSMAMGSPVSPLVPMVVNTPARPGSSFLPFRVEFAPPGKSAETVLPTGLPDNLVLQAGAVAPLGGPADPGVVPAFQAIPLAVGAQGDSHALGMGLARGSAIQAGCLSCGGGYVGPSPGSGAVGCVGCDECGKGCFPGQRECCCPPFKTCVGQFACELYKCICCPDPCYEPRWINIANNSFFQDHPRPVNHVRWRVDSGYNVNRPDRSEYFWARNVGGSGLPLAERTVDYRELSLYIETGTETAGASVETPYWSVDPDNNRSGVGFGDIKIGTKAVLLDCDLIMVTFQFKTFVPAGNVARGLGTGHVSLEPSFLMAIHVAQETYLQIQLSEWIPLGGDQNISGALMHFHTAINHMLWRPVPDWEIVGSFELNGWHFQDGGFTNPAGAQISGVGDTYLDCGLGARMYICKNIDFGMAAAFALTEGNFAEQLYRIEFQMRF